jgi:Zinc carboxypeptidase
VYTASSGYLIDMRLLSLIFIGAFALAMNALSQTADFLSAEWERSHISSMFPSDVRHADLLKYLEQLKKLGLSVNEVGRSYNGREICQVEWGKGPLKVFMWSQMHGDEPTATSALIDMFAFLQKNRDTPWVRNLSENVTIRAVPMLNPDGADMFQRRNQQGVDINRDALDLRTPEARLLKQLRDDWSPAIGFNLHNQQSLTTVGNSPNQATISLLVVFGDEAKTLTFGHERNRRVAAAIVSALQKFIPGHIARYGDEWTPTAFGDNFSAWGTSTILIETGALHGKDEMSLVKFNYVAFLTALNSLASGSERTQDPALYLYLPENGSGGLYNFIFRNATMAPSPGLTPIQAFDVAVNTDRRRASFIAPSFIRRIGDLSLVRGLEEYDVKEYTMVQRLRNFKVGELAEFVFYKRDRAIDWAAADLEKQYPPDAVFSGGKWLKGEVPVYKP